MKLKILTTILLAVGLTACSDDDERLGSFTDSGEFIVKVKHPVSASEFAECAVGYGWREDEIYEIKDDGTRERRSYWEDMDGGGPDYYEFGEGTAIKYVWLDAYPASVHYNYAMQYDETTGNVYFDGRKAFTVLSANSNEIRIVMGIGSADTYGYDCGCLKKIYYIVLKRLTAEQLQEIRDRYTMTSEDLEDWLENRRNDNN